MAAGWECLPPDRLHRRPIPGVAGPDCPDVGSHGHSWATVDAMSTPSVSPPVASGARRAQHPVVIAQQRKRAGDLQLRVADTITSFAGSMNFVYIHAVIFAVWMLAAEKSPWPT